MTQHSPLAIGEEQLGIPPRSCRNAVLFSKHNRNQIHVTFSYLIGTAMFLQQEQDSYRETTDNLVLHSCYQLLWHLERPYKSCNLRKTPRVTHGSFLLLSPWVTHGQNYVFHCTPRYAQHMCGLNVNYVSWLKIVRITVSQQIIGYESHLHSYLERGLPC